jgi:hypothetical protein
VELTEDDLETILSKYPKIKEASKKLAA